MGDILLEALSNILTLESFLSIFIGGALGIIFGALPGLTAAMGVALLLPITFGLEATTGILFLLGVYCGGIYGGSITAVLINTPGTPASAATTLDGHPLAKKGKAGKALRMAIFASVFGGIFSALILIIAAPQLAKVALKFGPPEYLALALFGLSVVSSVSGESKLKGLIMGGIGLLISTVGLDPVDASTRLMFGIEDLVSGIQLIPALIGLFAIAEIMNRSYVSHLKRQQVGDSKNQSKLTWTDIKKSLKTIIKSSGIGTILGAIPGAGPVTASFLSYNEAFRSSKNKAEFGKGSLEGVAAAESGNNGATGATLIPLLTLGIPGDAVTAILLGAFIMNDLEPGPLLFTDYGGIVYTIMIGLIVVNAFVFFQGQLAIRMFVKITKVPNNILIPILLTLCIVGAYAVNNSMFDVRVMMIFGIIGFFLLKFGFPVTPLLLALILGPIAENGMRQSLSMSGGDWSIFYTRPISFIFIVISVIAFFIPLVAQHIFNSKKDNKS